MNASFLIDRLYALRRREDDTVSRLARLGVSQEVPEILGRLADGTVLVLGRDGRLTRNGVEVTDPASLPGSAGSGSCRPLTENVIIVGV